MNVSDNRAFLRVWHFQCPECGIGDVEFGHLLTGDDIFCEACLHDMDEPRSVRLWRWHTEDVDGSQRVTAVLVGEVTGALPRTAIKG